MNEPPVRTSQRIRAARARTRPQGLSAMLLAFSVLFVLAYVFIVRTPPQPPVPDLASASGTYTWQSTSGDATLSAGGGDFAARSGGDAGGTFLPADAGAARVTSAYDAARRTERTSVGGAQGDGAGGITVGSWPPAWRLRTRSPLDFQGLSAIVRAAVEDGDTSVGIKPLEQDGRKVWRAALQLDGTTQELVVDQSSGLVTWWTDGASTFTADVAWSGAQASSASPESTGGSAVRRVDRTYTYEPSLAAAGEAAGFDPLVSDLSPDGFAAAASATAEAGDAPGSWDPGTAAGGSGAARQVVQLFTRGLTWFEVRQLGSGASSLDALRRALETARATALSFEQTPLQYGAFAGRTASTWYASSGPALLVGDERRVVFVTGTLTRQELLSLAEGLKPLTAGATASPAASPSPAAIAP